MSASEKQPRTWTKETVLEAIRQGAESGHDLSYTRSEKRDPSLVRAAQRLYGHWRTAVEAAGFSYSSVSRYKRWTRERVIERIRELDAQDEDLSWRNVAKNLDPSLAAAALRNGRFETWAEALKAAGLDPDQVSRYRHWTVEQIQGRLQTLVREGVTLDRSSLQKADPALLAAIYRIGGGLHVQCAALERHLIALREELLKREND